MAFGKNECLTLTPNMWQHKTRSFTQCGRWEFGPWHWKQESIHSTKCIGTVLGARDKAVDKIEKNPCPYFVLNEVKSGSEPPRSREMRNSGFVMFTLGGRKFIRGFYTIPGSYTFHNILRWALCSSDHISYHCWLFMIQVFMVPFPGHPKYLQGLGQEYK